MSSDPFRTNQVLVSGTDYGVRFLRANHDTQRCRAISLHRSNQRAAITVPVTVPAE